MFVFQENRYRVWMIPVVTVCREVIEMLLVLAWMLGFGDGD
ncbi:hypothetical Protein YC6258_02598 [Gynuella sunshinyii YC6258]|uniref:Uncharacterized protein n=1 Tax=Gynuella sunshinyii YC6258 TaxID=1445510 RepID=A0A0C5VIY8_9GAMM|nr:hypothetical Protein YC6258_02598 [Gynuella sunshinyii YC6258]